MNPETRIIKASLNLMKLVYQRYDYCEVLEEEISNLADFILVTKVKSDHAILKVFER